MRRVCNRWLVAVVAVFGSLQATAQVLPAPTPAPSTVAAAAIAHPLINKIWDTAKARFVTPAELVTVLSRAGIVIVGERHGHMPHQERTAFLLNALADRERYPALALEMLEPRQAVLINRYRRDEPEYAGRLGSAMQWYDTGWPSWAFYEPIFQAAFMAKLPILAADLPRSEQERIERTGLETPPSSGDDAALASWRVSMKSAHCDMIDDDRLKRVAELQWARDAAMARAAEEGLQSSGSVVLLAGLAHARRDRGIARHLVTAGKSSAGTAIVAFMDVRDGVNDVAPYVPVPLSPTPTASSASHVYDFVWFTPPKPGGDVCDRIRGLVRPQ